VNGFAVIFGALLLAVVAFLLVLTLNRLGQRASRPRPLKSYFLRLGRVAPGDVCPCKQDASSKRSYGQCCRPKDIEKLERDVREFLWRRWAKRSYGGRRRMRTLEQRLEDHPMPEVILPEWVTHPEDHVFPVSEQLLRTWSPDRRRKSVPCEPQFEDSTVDDVI